MAFGFFKPCARVGAAFISAMAVLVAGSATAQDDEALTVAEGFQTIISYVEARDGADTDEQKALADKIAAAEADEFSLTSDEYDELLLEVAADLETLAAPADAAALYEKVIRRETDAAAFETLRRAFQGAARAHLAAGADAEADRVYCNYAAFAERIFAASEARDTSVRHIFSEISVYERDRGGRLICGDRDGEVFFNDQDGSRYEKRALELSQIEALRADAFRSGDVAEDERACAAGNTQQLIRVFYGTAREAGNSDDPYKKFEAAKIAEDSALSLGTVDVSVPCDRNAGQLPKAKWWRGQFIPNPENHVILKKIDVSEDRNAFFSGLRDHIQTSDRKETFVYIHGFKNSFVSAAERTAQMAVDLEIDGAPVMFSWPSRSWLLSYVADADLSQDGAIITQLSAFLKDVAEQSGAERVHVIAHSMGNRFLLQALDQLRVEHKTSDGALFDEIVMASPDVRVTDFQTRTARVAYLSKRMTLYASKRDRALALSKRINAGRRAGDAAPPLVLPNVETVDTTRAAFEVLGHSDFARGAVDDFRSIVWFSLAPEARCILSQSTAPEGRFWTFGAPGCDRDEFRYAVTLFRRFGADGAKRYAFRAAEAARAENDAKATNLWRGVEARINELVRFQEF